MEQTFKLFFQAVYWEGKKAIWFSLQFYYLEVLNQDGTPSRATVICPDWSSGLDAKSWQPQTKDSHIS